MIITTTHCTKNHCRGFCSFRILCCALSFSVLFSILGLFASCKGESSPTTNADTPPSDHESFCAQAELKLSHSISNLREESSTGFALLNLKEKLRETGFDAIGTVELGLTDSSTGIFDIDTAGDLIVKDQNSFLMAIEPGSFETEITLDGSRGLHCLTLFLEYIPVFGPAPVSDLDGFFIPDVGELYLPYFITVSHSAGPQPSGTVRAGSLPDNYIGRVLVVKDKPEDVLQFEITAVRPDHDVWHYLFNIDPDTGVLSFESEQSEVGALFVFSDELISSGKREVYYLSELFTIRKSAGLSIPIEFELDIKVSEEKVHTGDTIDHPVTLKVQIPSFGSADCSILELSTSTSTATEEEIASQKERFCRHLDYEIKPKGKEFVTSEADLDNLPEGLSQAKENYQIIFRDEFSQDGGPEVLDSRLWRGTLLSLDSCHRFENVDGALHLGISSSCTAAVAEGAGKAVQLQSNFEYKYGYIEAGFRLLASEGIGAFFWNSWPRTARAKHVREDDYDIWCNRGQSLLNKRMRWLHLHGVEMQYLELTGKSTARFSGPWVFHVDENERAAKCNSDWSIFSGLYWKNFDVRPSYFTGDQPFRLGVEWTPAGYRGFENGESTEGQNGRGIYYHYGYGHPAADQPSPLGDYQQSGGGITIPSSNLIQRSVSHAYQFIRFHLSGRGNEVVIDYIRVYQPKDKYAGETKNYD